MFVFCWECRRWHLDLCTTITSNPFPVPQYLTSTPHTLPLLPSGEQDGRDWVCVWRGRDWGWSPLQQEPNTAETSREDSRVVLRESGAHCRCTPVMSSSRAPFRRLVASSLRRHTAVCKVRPCTCLPVSKVTSRAWHPIITRSYLFWWCRCRSRCCLIGVK